MNRPKTYTTYLLSEPVKLPFAPPYGQLSLIYNVDRCLSLFEDYDDLIADITIELNQLKDDLDSKGKEFSKKWKEYMDSLPKKVIDYPQVLNDIQNQLLLENNPDPEIAFNKIKILIEITGQLLIDDVELSPEYLADRKQLETSTAAVIKRMDQLQKDIDDILINHVIDSIDKWPGAWGSKPSDLTQINLCGNYITSSFVKKWIIKEGALQVREQLKNLQMKQ